MTTVPVLLPKSGVMPLMKRLTTYPVPLTMPAGRSECYPVTPSPVSCLLMSPLLVLLDLLLTSESASRGMQFASGLTTQFLLTVRCTGQRRKSFTIGPLLLLLLFAGALKRAPALVPGAVANVRKEMPGGTRPSVRTRVKQVLTIDLLLSELLLKLSTSLNPSPLVVVPKVAPRDVVESFLRESRVLLMTIVKSLLLSLGSIVTLG